MTGTRPASETVIAGRAALSVNDPGTPVPRGWKRVRLTEAARLESGHTPSRRHPEYWGGNVPWISIPDARENHGGVITSTEEMVTQKGIDNSSARLLPKGTVCLSRTASVGYCTIMGRPMATSQDFVDWVCSEALDPKFLLNAFLAEGDGLRDFGKGSVHTTIYFPEVLAFHLALPPLNEQRRIVAKVEALMERSRRAKEALAAIPPLLDQLRQSILAAAFRGDLTADWRAQHPDVEPATELLKRIRTERRHRWEAAELAKLKAKGKTPGDDRWKAKYEEPEPVDDSELPELPEGWCWAALEELAWDGPTNGYSPPASADGQGTLSLKLSATTSGEFCLSERTVKHLEETIPPDSKYWLQPGDILVQRANTIDIVGTAAVYTGPENHCIYPDLMMRLRLVTCVDTMLFGHLLNAPPVRAYFRENATGTAGNMPKVNGQVVRRAVLAVPPVREQREVLRCLSAGLEASHALASSVSELSESAIVLDSAILAKAFRGELVPQDPNDEPASMLLERIRAEKSDEPAKKGWKRP